jgi:hypothetical protein
VGRYDLPCAANVVKADIEPLLPYLQAIKSGNMCSNLAPANTPVKLSNQEPLIVLPGKYRVLILVIGHIMPRIADPTSNDRTLPGQDGNL